MIISKIIDGYLLELQILESNGECGTEGNQAKEF